MRNVRRLISLSLALCVMLLATACASGTTGSAGGTPTGGSATATPQRVKITVKTGDTSLCDLVSLADFSKAVGAPVTKLSKSSIAMSNGAIDENCLYEPPSLPGTGGGISYIVIDNAASYYTMIKQSQTENLNSENDLTGVGDAAFWGTSKSSPDAFMLGMVKDNVVVAISMDGGGADGSAFLPNAEQLAKQIASHL